MLLLLNLLQNRDGKFYFSKISRLYIVRLRAFLEIRNKNFSIEVAPVCTENCLFCWREYEGAKSATIAGETLHGKHELIRLLILGKGSCKSEIHYFGFSVFNFRIVRIRALIVSPLRIPISCCDVFEIWNKNCHPNQFQIVFRLIRFISKIENTTLYTAFKQRHKLNRERDRHLQKSCHIVFIFK